MNSIIQNSNDEIFKRIWIRTFLIRGDMDALPMKEETGLPFCSLNGKGDNYGVHDSRLAFDEGALHKMAVVYAVSAVRWLEEHY